MWAEASRRDAGIRWHERIAVVTPHAHKAYGLACAVEGLRVLTAGEGGSGSAPEPVVAAFRAVGAELVAVPVEGASTTRSLLEAAETGEWLERWGRPGVVVFRPDAASLARLDALGCRLVGADPGIARRLENKRAFRALCGELGLPVVDGSELRWPPGPENRAHWEGYAGQVVVVQTPRGFAGKRTWRWQVGAELPAVPERLAGQSVLMAPFVEGPTWTVNAVAGSRGVRVGAAMRQVTGDPRLTELALASCGVAIGAEGAEAVRAELVGLARAVGEAAAERGFVGFFGIDAVGMPGALKLVEMNPRLTATLTVATLAEMAVGVRPLLLDHVDVCLGEPLAEAPDVGLEGMSGGHLIVRESSGWRARVPAQGRYRVGGNGLERVGELPEWPGPDEVSVWSGGEDFGAEEDLGVLVFSGPMMDGAGELTPLVEGTLAEIVSAA